jgi:tetratricopeptide (TPR) repeat protein
LTLASFALANRAEIPAAREIVAQESGKAISLDPEALPRVARLLTDPTVEPDLLWRAVPRDVVTLVELGGILEEQGRMSTAATALEDAVAVASTPSEKASVRLARARFLMRRGDATMALAQAREALALAPRDAEAFAVLAEAYEASGRLGEAESAIESALAMSGDGDPQKLSQRRDHLASLLARRGDTAGVLALRRRAVQSAPNDAEAHLNLAKALEAGQQLADAVHEYETARALGPDDWQLQWTVAQALLRSGLLREATAAAEQAIKLNPTSDDLRVELGNLYSRMGRPDRATDQYRQVLAREPTHEAAIRGLRAVGGLKNPG